MGESFRNVDLFHQGLYHLRTRIYRDESELRVLAVLYGHFTCPVQAEQPKQKSTRINHHNLVPAHISDDECVFSTRSFLIRYCEEEVELNDICQFRIEFDSEASEHPTPLFLEMELMFADLTQHGGADRFGEQPDVDATEFKCVSTQLFCVHGADQGLHEFVPVVFDEFHFCLANVVIHSVLLDFRLRMKSHFPACAQPKPMQGKGEQNDNNDVAQAPPPPSAQNAALSLAECLFASSNTESREQLLQITEALYQQYLGTLIASYTQLESWFKRICEKCLTPSQREVFGESIEVPELRLPHSVARRDSSNSTSAPSLLSISVAELGSDVNEQTVAMHLVYDVNVTSSQILEMWHKVLNVASYACRETTALLRAIWEQRIVDQWSTSIVKEAVRADIAIPQDKAIWESHNRISEEMRKAVKNCPDDSVLVEDMSLMPKIESHPILFQQRYGCGVQEGIYDECVPSAPKPYRGVHLFVLVHGFQGNALDMRLMKNNIALLYPDAICLCSNSNEENTEGDINEMGIRLAQEVVNFISDWCSGSALGRLSFIAHSIGGLIVRAALPMLLDYRSKMFTLLTFSTPHLGYFQNSISLFHTGFWVLKKWRKSMCLEQLAMTDNSNPRDTFLYQLSKTRGLEFFQGVVLVSSYQDQYAPFESARVELCSHWDKQPDKDVYTSMVNNVWESVKPERVFRFDVNFKIPENNLDSFIGRAAHIQFLECQPIMKMIIHNYSFLFG